MPLNWQTNENVVDTTAPTLSSLTAAKVGSSGWSGSVSTDEANGTLYWIVTENSSETDATVKAGNSRVVTSTGAQALSGSGLTAETTYYLHVLHRDAAGNDSTQPTAVSFTTDALGSGTGTVTLAVTRRMANATVPEAVFMRATVSVSGITTSDPNTGFDESWNDVVYLWNFGDTQQSTNGVNLPAAFNDLSTGGGREVCHVYLTAGTHAVTCDAYRLDGTFIGRGTLNVTVSTSSAYAGNRTILVDSTGTGDDTTYPGSQVFTTFPAAEAAATTLGGAVRILLKRGETYSLTSNVNFSTGITNLYLGAWGSGAMPKVRAAGGFSGTQLIHLGSGLSGDARIDQIDIEGLYNPETESGTLFDCIRTQQHNSRSVLITRCRMHRGVECYNVVDLGSDTSQFMSVVHDCDVSGWMDYGLYFGRYRENGAGSLYLAVIGGAVYQNVNANMGGNGKSGSFIRHGPMRFIVGHHVYVDAVDMFSRNSWPTGFTPPGVQPCIRFATNDNFNLGQSKTTSGVIRRCALEASEDMITNTSDGEVSGYSTGSSRNLLIEDCYAVGSTHTTSFFNTEFSGFTLRNNILVIPNLAAPSWKANRAQFIDFPGINGGINYPGKAWKSRAYNNTMIDYRTSGITGGGTKNMFDTPSALSITDFAHSNNIHWCPNDTGQSDTSTNPQLDLSTAVATIGGTHVSRFLGWKWDDSPTMDTSKGTPNGLAATFIPGASSPALNASTGTSAPFDIYGNAANGTRDVGAVERQ